MARAPRTSHGPRLLTREEEAVYAADEASLDDEERTDMEALHAGLADGSIVSIMTPALHADTQARARATLDALKSTKRITVRISPVDLQTLQQKAQELGLPYQTLLKSVLHQYLTGQLVPRSSAV
jgi:hypothetical protein